MNEADVERLAAALGLPLEPGSAAAMAEQLAGLLSVSRVAAPFMEAHLFRVAACLETDGVVAAPVASARGETLHYPLTPAPSGRAGRVGQRAPRR